MVPNGALMRVQSVGVSISQFRIHSSVHTNVLLGIRVSSRNHSSLLSTFDKSQQLDMTMLISFGRLTAKDI